jgi:FkbM family methyltransferase
LTTFSLGLELFRRAIEPQPRFEFLPAQGKVSRHALLEYIRNRATLASKEIAPVPLLKYRTRTLTPLSALVPEITYVMCGARGETGNRLLRALPQIKFVGFEPDPEEHARLTARPTPGFTYFPVAVGERDQRHTLYITRNPACSSLLRPNHALYSRFQDCGPDLEVVREASIDIVSLDTFLPKSGIHGIDLLDLDTQGSELEILRGAQSFLASSIVAIKCEVEFSPLYLDQPLFGDVDAYLRSFGFMLFDVSRSRYRRANFPPHALTRGQLLWGDAIFLRDHHWFSARAAKSALFKLCLLAAHLQFHDYALEVLESLLSGRVGPLTPEEHEALMATRRQYLRDLSPGARWVDVLYGLEAIGMQRPMKLIGRLASQLGDRLRKDRSMTEYNWTD